ncbi:MAG TPA: hypothetical protein VLX44_13590 [Xanthobacteraceae bacterium]|nr:hypothetical protein [Xanthobacteraceae bacterium]
MTSIAFNARTATVAVYAAKLLRRGKRLLLRFAAVNAETRIHRARLESEVFLKYYRLRTKNDDDLPIVR